MCGIAGVWTRARDGVDAGRLSSSLSALRHRGPNDCGQEVVEIEGARLFLGHTRLSIIDLTAGGHQPMRREQGRYSVIYNGEIYNYRELRDELRAAGDVFTSDSDTEVLLAAWARWRNGALPRLKGMFAFALHDSVEQTLTLARDPFGIKPLFYSDGDGHFAFASELPALRVLLPSPPRLDRQRAYDYLVYSSYDDGERTFYEGVRHLLPGHALRLDLRTGRADTSRWWWPAIDERPGVTFAEAAERVRELFLENVRLHLRSDVPLGAALSGGIDSSAIVCAMRRVEPDMPIHTFSYVARGSALNEEPWADIVNAEVGAIAHKVTATPLELVADLDDMIRAQGEPFGSTSIYAQYRVFRLARESGITVTLEGQGADELFAGYHGYPGAVLRELLAGARVADAARFTLAWSRWPGRTLGQAALLLGQELAPDQLRDVALRLIGRSPEPEWLDTRALRDAGVRTSATLVPRQYRSAARPLAARLRHSLLRQSIPQLLRHGDRNSMRWSIESRVPFLTADMAEYVLGLPSEYLVSRAGETKHVLRAALRGLVPDLILDRRDKVGFATPERDWLMQISGTVRQWLAEDAGIEFLDQRRMLADFDLIMSGRAKFSWQVWRWINFVHWHRMFLHT